MKAFPNVEGDHFVLTEEILAKGFRESAASPRKRIILPLHRTMEASVQRMLNFFQPGTHVQPHRHPEEGASETVQVLCGCLGYVLFAEDGEVRSSHRLEAGSCALVDIEPGVWHSMVALEPDTVILEAKQGPYVPIADKDFAAWAPAEGDAGAEAFRERLEKLFE